MKPSLRVRSVSRPANRTTLIVGLAAIFGGPAGARAESPSSSYLRFQVQTEDQLGGVLNSLGLCPIWGDTGFVARTRQLNPETILKSGEFENDHVVIRLPVSALPPLGGIVVSPEGVISLTPAARSAQFCRHHHAHLAAREPAVPSQPAPQAAAVATAVPPVAARKVYLCVSDAAEADPKGMHLKCSVATPRTLQDANLTIVTESHPEALRAPTSIPAAGSGASELSPQGRVMSTPGPLTFSWISPEGAHLHQVTLEKRQADRKSWVKVATVETLNHDSTTDLGGTLPAGHYRWTVASRSDDGATVLGSSQADLEVEDPSVTEVGHGTIWGGFDMTTLSFDGTSRQFTTSLSPQLTGPAIFATYVPYAHLGFDFGYRGADFSFRNEVLDYRTVSAGAVYGHELGLGGGWSYSAGLRLGWSSLPEVLATSDTEYSTGQVMRWELIPSLKILKQLDPKVSMYGRVSVPVSLHLYGGTNGAIEDQPAQFRYRVHGGLQAAWFWPWGVSAEVAAFRDGYKFTTASDQVDVSMTGYEVLFGLFYSF